jgi:hypothetical protein
MIANGAHMPGIAPDIAREWWDDCLCMMMSAAIIGQIISALAAGGDMSICVMHVRDGDR